ncbi:Mitochondrial presequence protease [Coemansia sp. RSA 1722]|nr:Mitochondrial presequence protease [Coemansia sp. RSA 486]KAJ2598307.1 Mitochondrial presequence protease [Coemansia sp. RSA 1722]KAJ2602663.1 Mitochondrial presequence protease [Coemansia sp. RSA 1721]KAJ2640284.1 Mitochondrial presequence protease [Coemansia sp. RSA 1286]
MPVAANTAVRGARMLAASSRIPLLAAATQRRSIRSPLLTRLFSSSAYPRQQNQEQPQGTTAGSLTKDQELHGFVVEDIQSVSELKLRAIRLRHQKTNLEWLHIDRDDRNNVFSIGFNTSVSDSTGVPHILEHTTLCGSENYPVRDPFFKMLNRSMSTFMNAWTAHDYTQYPFATQNAQDYENLQRVYLDAVFRPVLREMDFRQEGWRLERNGQDSGWQFKGVVYNEMKGAFSDAGSLYATRAEQQLFPGTTYQYVSGGDPEFIPDLTHEQLVAFHRERYHPSNARVYTYGNLPLAPQLERVGRLMDSYDRISPVHVPMDVEEFGEKQVTELGPVESVGQPDKQTRFSLSFLANDLRNVYDTFSMSVFSNLLLSGTSAPMHKALIDSHIGSDYSANTGYSPFTRRTSLAVGLQGIADSDISLVETRIRETFALVHRQGFERRRVDAALANVELAYKHRTADFGLSLMKSISTGWFHGVNPVEYLKVSENVARLRADVERGGFFESLAERYFLNSKHTLKYAMLPDTKYNQRLDQREHEMIQNKLDTLSSADLAAIDQKNEQLAEEQMRKEDLSSLPTLTLQDVPEQAGRFALDMGVAGDEVTVPVQWRTTSTNGISYLRVINDVRDKYPELRPYLPLFCDALTYLGTKTRDMAEIETDIRLHTGGVSFAPFVTTDLANLGHIEAGISYGSHCLDQHIDDMYRLVLELVRETNFDNTDRLRALLNAVSSSMFNDVASSGHAYARRLAASTLAPEAQALEALNGITQVKFISDLARLTDLSPVVEKLKQVQEVVFNKLTMRSAITTNVGGVDENQRALERFLEKYPKLTNDDSGNNGSDMSADQKFVPANMRFFCPLPVATNYAGKATRTVPYNHPDSVKLQMLAKFLTPNYLHREIRERNGAYGGGAGYSAIQGIFSFFSYRDPSPIATIDTFAKSVEWLLHEHQVSEREMMEAKLSVFGDLDHPLSVAEEGMTYFTTGVTDDMRQERRDRFFAVTANDLKDVAEKYLASKDAGKVTSVAVIGEESLDISGDWTQMRLQ